MNTKKTILGIYALLVIAVFAFRIGAENYVSVVETLNYITLAVLLLFAYMAIKYFTLQSDIGRSIAFIAAGAISWTIADIIYYSEWITNNLYQIPDVIYIFGYGLIIIGLIHAIRMVDPDLSKKKQVIALALIGFIIITTIYFSFIFKVDAEEGSWTNAINALYIIGDLVVLIFAVLLIWSAAKTTFAKAWITIAIAAIVTFIADIWYINAENYQSGDPLELLYMLSYIIFALGFVLLQELAQKELGMDTLSSPTPAPSPNTQTLAPAPSTTTPTITTQASIPQKSNPKPKKKIAKKVAASKKSTKKNSKKR